MGNIRLKTRGEKNLNDLSALSAQLFFFVKNFTALLGALLDGTPLD